MRELALRTFVLLLVCCPFPAVARGQWRAQIEPFVRSHCADCHHGESAEGGLDLARLDTDLDNPEVKRRWILVHDRIANGEMPPRDVPRPAAGEIGQTLAIMSKAITNADLRQRGVVLRRLNRIEYENTVGDLFGIDVRVKQTLPEDSPTAGFDNVGEGLAVSAEAMQAYLRAADIVLDAVFGPPERPKSIRHETNLLDQKTHDGKPQLANQLGKMFRKTDRGIVIFQSGYCPTNLVNFARLWAPAGTYRGTLQVRAVQSDQPVTLRIYGGDTIVGRREKHLVGYYDVPPDRWTTIEFEDRLVEDGGTFQPKCYGTRDTRKDADTYPEPGIEIAEITIEGPLEPWPPLSRQRLLGEVDPSTARWEDADRIIRRLLPRAFRRPVQPAEAAPFVELVRSALADDRPFEQALRLGLKAILCSPEFLFLEEKPREDAATIDDFALASRLSYFLWSSMPDDQLLALAAQGQLRDGEVLRRQVERMLNDPRAAAFTKNFTGQWLDLRDIEFTVPDANLYPEFDELLLISMVRETELFFEEVLRHDLSLMNFVDSDFTFLNERLAKHYGIDGVEGQRMRRVELADESVRGGVLTQASVLKVTANGTNTSPVLRGVWVLENILGQPAPPPPPGVAAIEPDIRGARTLREQLEKHRNVASCAMCHDKIDPPGFALENFDPIGGWREHYRTVGEGQRPDIKQSPFTFAWIRYRIGLPVDAAGTTPDGERFEDIRQFKQLLGREQDAIARGLTEKMFTYAIGRPIGFSDRPAIENTVNHLRANDYGFRTLVHAVVQSEMFRQP